MKNCRMIAAAQKECIAYSTSNWNTTDSKTFNELWRNILQNFWNHADKKSVNFYMEGTYNHDIVCILAAGKQHGHACRIDRASGYTEEPLLLHDHTYL